MVLYFSLISILFIFIDSFNLRPGTVDTFRLLVLSVDLVILTPEHINKQPIDDCQNWNLIKFNYVIGEADCWPGELRRASTDGYRHICIPKRQ